MIGVALTLALAVTPPPPCPTGMEEVRTGVCRHAGLYVDEANPSGLRQKLTPDKPELDSRRIELGRLLFFDRLLSRDRTLSCASCHDPRQGLSAPRRTVLEAPALWNATFKRRFFWDGRAVTLEEQALGPLREPTEMAMAPGEPAERVKANPEYRELFLQAFGPTEITDELIVAAIADFERTLVSLGSRFDRYAAGDFAAFSAEELKGFNVFRSFVSRCPECHTPPLFTNGQLALIGAPEAGHGTPKPMLVPSLRNVSRTAPYMQSGAFDTLDEVLAFYKRGGGPDVAAKAKLPIHWHMRPLPLTGDELAALKAFLLTLDDESRLPEVPAAVPSGLPVLD
jgi:cytochrome c peroxidase